MNPTGVLIAFLAVVAVIGWIGYLIVTYWMWIVGILGVGAGLVVLFYVVGAFLDGSWSSTAPASSASPDVVIAAAKRDRSAAQQVAVKAVVERRQIHAARLQLEAECRKVVEARSRISGQVNFQLLAQMHFQSRQLADAWYSHKRSAESSERLLARSISALERDKANLSGVVARLGGTQRSSAVMELDATSSAISTVRSNLTELSAEVTRGRSALDRHNIETGRLRDHIRDTCGARGRKWYDDLQKRIAARNQ